MYCTCHVYSRRVSDCTVCIKHVHNIGGFEHCLTIDNSEDIVIPLDL